MTTKIIYDEITKPSDCPYRKPIFDNYNTVIGFVCSKWHEETTYLRCERLEFPEYCLLADDVNNV